MKSSDTKKSSRGEGGTDSSNSTGGQVILVSLLALSAYLTLFALRAIDDNRLTSWQWVFAEADAPRLAAILIVGIALAYGLSRVPLPVGRAGPLLFGSSFLVAALFWREPEVIVDAARYFSQAKHLEVYGLRQFLDGWGREVGAWTDLPLVPFLFGMIFTVWGESRVAVQAFTTLLFSGTVALTYLVGKTLWDEALGLHAGALLLGMPYLVTQVPLMLVDVPTMFFLMLAVFATLRALERAGPAWMGLASVAVACALLSKYSAWLLLTVLPVMVLAQARRGPGVTLLRASVVCVAALSLAGTALLWKHDVVANQLRLLWSYQAPALGRWGESFASTFLFQIHPFITAAAAWSTVVALRRRDSRYAIVAWLPLLVVALKIERIRYLVPVLPMLALMASYGLREIRVRSFAVSSVVISALAVALFGYLPFLMTVSAVNLKEAGAYLDSLEAPRVEVLALPQPDDVVNPAVSVPLLDLFTRKGLVFRDGPGGAPAESERSPLRFTWEQRTPPYYAVGAGDWEGGGAVVLILARRDQPLPEEVKRRISGHRLARVFDTSEDRFQYQTLVEVYERVDGLRLSPGEGRKGPPWQ